MVIVESTLSHKIFSEQFEGQHVDVDKLTLGLAKAGAVVMFAYFFLKLQGVIDNHALGLIGVGFYGKWWLVEMLGLRAAALADVRLGRPQPEGDGGPRGRHPRACSGSS